MIKHLELGISRFQLAASYTMYKEGNKRQSSVNLEPLVLFKFNSKCLPTHYFKGLLKKYSV